MKLFIKKLLLYTIIFFTVIVTVNLVVDPANIVTGIESKVADLILQELNVTNITNLDERLLQKKIIQAESMENNAIVLGSSRIMLFGTKYLGQNSFNHGVSGATLEDFISLFQLYQQSRHMPQKIFLGIDPWIFNTNNGQSRWLSLKKEYQAYHGVIVDSVAEALPVFKYVQFFEITYFQESLKKIINNFPAKVGGLIVTHEKQNEELTRLSDGTISYGRAYREITLDQVDGKAKEYINDSLYSIEDFNEMSADLRMEFEKFIDRLLQEGISLELILIPYHPTVYEYIKSSSKYKIVMEVETYIKSLTNKYEFSVTGSYDPASLNMDSSYFYDGMHINEKGVEKIILANQWGLL
jgi:hypothetical protein